jgi:hypothetical protein
LEEVAHVDTRVFPSSANLPHRTRGVGFSTELRPAWNAEASNPKIIVGCASEEKGANLLAYFPLTFNFPLFGVALATASAWKLLINICPRRTNLL